MNFRMLFFLSCSLVAITAFGQDAPSVSEFPKGEIVEKVVTSGDGNQSYALYLPSNYTAEKKWPILYCFDPRENGKRPAELFRDAAEKYGYIIASSNNFRSDDATVPGMQTFQAMRNDTRNRFSIQEDRLYATGFSGGARVSCDIGWQGKGSVAGVIGCGAGFPPDRPASAKTPFAYYGIVGNRDFNYFEMTSLQKTLSTINIPFQIEVFDGTHEWPPAEDCTEAIEWMEIRAMKDGKKPKDPALIDSLYDKRWKTASTLESSGSNLDAYDEYSTIARDFEGLHDTAAAIQKSTALNDSPPVAKERQELSRREQKSVEFNAKLGSVIKSMRDSSRPVPKPETVLAYLGIDDLKKESGTGSPADRAAADSLLEQLFVQCVFYLPRTFIQYGDYPRALLCYEIAAKAKENNPYVWYNMASVYALMGDKKNALDALKRAVNNGFDDALFLQEDSDFESIREDKEYQKLIETIRKKADSSKNGR